MKLLLLLSLSFLVGCRQPNYACDLECQQAHTAPPIAWKLLGVMSHGSRGYTEGLTFVGDRLFESTGLAKRSALFELDPRDGHVLRSLTWSKALGPGGPSFAEGLAAHAGTLYQLSWKDQRAELWRIDDFAHVGEVPYTEQGWGLTVAGDELYRSDGSARIHVHAPVTFQELTSYEVKSGQIPITKLNELEAIGSDILANVWFTSLIVRFDRTTGAVNGVLDLQPLIDREDAYGNDAVLNGIAYQESTGRLYVTGKQWKHIYVIALVR